VTKSGDRRVVSKRLLFVEIDGPAMRATQLCAYLDYRPLKEMSPISADPGAPGVRLDRQGPRGESPSYAIANVVPEILPSA